MKFGFRTPSLKKRISARTSVKRAIRSKVRVPKGYGILTNPKKAMYNKVYNRTTRKACYIATAVYGDQDAWQVEKLRQYRDNCLSHHFTGRIFIFLYYLVSPQLVSLFKNVRIVNELSRRLLDNLVERI